MRLVDHRCNVCGAPGRTPLDAFERERATCDGCGSTPRFRAVIHALSVELFGASLTIDEFGAGSALKGVGLSDWGGYANRLVDHFDYTNTYYHQEPRLDVVAGAPELEGALDFVISSEVFEHVPPPVGRVFENVRRMLKPGGVLILTVPYGDAPQTLEHYPELNDFEVVEEDGRHRLRNTTRDGREQVFDDLIFHGGPGFTLEMRYFSRKALLAELIAAGFDSMTIHGPCLRHGVYWKGDWAYPIAARA